MPLVLKRRLIPISCQREMVLIIARIKPNFLFPSPTLQNHRQSSLTDNQNGHFCIRPSSRISFVSPISHRSGSTICPSDALTKRNLDYNAQIFKFCEMGHLENAMELLHQSPKTELDTRTYCLMLQLCAEHKSLKNGKKVHSIICSNGLAIEGVLGAKLVFMYVTCGDLEEGRRIFDKVANEKIFLWNLMMNEYAKTGSFRESISLFGKMVELGVEANSHTFSCVFKCFGALGSVEEGQRVHGYLLKLGFGSYNSVVNSLIAFYFKNGRVESARKVFDALSERDVISWNTMISGYVANGFAAWGLKVFEEMLSSGIDIDSATMVSVLMGCASFGTRSLSLGRALHAHAIKANQTREMIVNNNLMDMYSKCGDFEGAVLVFEKMGKRSVVSWTSMIAGYVREGQSEGAIRLFHEMEKQGISPDIFTVTSILHACACSGSLEIGKDVHNFIKDNNMQSNLFVCNALMDMYAKCGSMEGAYSVFSQMRVKDIVSWNTMIGGYSKNSLPNEALGLFVDMQKELRPDSITAACILPACASLSTLERGQEIHGHILRNGFSSERHVANALVDMYVKSGALSLARLLFDLIPSKDLISWTVMIAGYGMHGFGTEAIATFNEMTHAGIDPDEVSFISILYACSHSGLLNEGWKLFDTMRNDYNIEPKAEHYACMVDLLARTGNLTEAYRFIETMPIEPDGTIWGALLCGCRIHHDVELAEKVAEHVFKLEPENTAYYVLLSNIYAEAEKWEKVQKMRERIGRQGLKKNPGCSWIEINGKFQIFTAGGTSHPQAKKIESLLKRLRMRMKEEGFFPKTRYALINADDAEKEAALCGHSEKLAMALGVLSLPPAKTIRVTKNLRVCGDCHETAKFMSKMFKREIVLRDSNRFHHFKEGRCSCRGFW